MRRQLLEAPVIVHGDMHPGNVLLRRQGRKLVPVFLDWVRVRLGSPMEDVSSWLQSLGYWEPDARRRHDTLLKRYLEASGRGSTLSSSVREHYGLAGASNALAGALRYHLFPAMARMASTVRGMSIRSRRWSNRNRSAPMAACRPAPHQAFVGGRYYQRQR
jgi:aminoglycoside phosphotransferase (APT) family kinase protein